MKKLVYCFSAIAIIALVYGFSPSPQGSSCDSKTLKKEGISMLNPYYYSSSKVSEIAYDYRPTRKEIEVPLFKGEKYKMVFNKKALPKDVVVEIYDRDKSHEGRTPVFTSQGSAENIISYEPKKSKKMYVNYLIPAAKGEKEKGCIAFVLGYQLTFIKPTKTESDSE